MAESLNKNKKPIYKKWWFWVIIIFFIFWSIGISQRRNEDVTQKVSSNIQDIDNKIDKDLSKVIYQDKNFLVKITDYEYSNVSNVIKVNMYIENNSDKDTTFTINSGVSINSTMVKGGYFYQEVNSKTKANSSFTLSNLRENNINENNLEKMQFKLNIYQSKNYVIENRIADNLNVVYEF